MIRGWFIGSFHPTALNTNVVEVAVKSYVSGDFEGRHHHKIATEVTLLIRGKARMNNVEYSDGDIIVIPPGESTDFLALTDLIIVAVKIPGATDDKYDGR